MKILFLSLLDFDSFYERNIYSDLMREFIRNGHHVYCISPVERRSGKKTHVIWKDDNCILKPRTGNMQKTNFIEKGISTLFIESVFIRAIKRYFSDVKFDLVLYPTPPITFAKVVKYVKQRDGAKSYLMLKDIFPQNSVDLGVLSKTGLKGFIYRYFRKMEERLYALSDTIGCMSQANCEYVLKHNPEIMPNKVELCPNGIEPLALDLLHEEKKNMRVRYSLPLDKKIFVYGGNLGRPQDVPFIVKCLKACAKLDDVHFVIAGSGTDRHYIDEYIEAEKPKHVTVFDFLPRVEYDTMIACCDVGLVFLNHRFTIPNFPSRLLSCMQAGLPILCCTDSCTDVGQVVSDGGFGWRCQSDDEQSFKYAVEQVLQQKDLFQMGKIGHEYLLSHYTAKRVCEIIE